MLWQWLWWWRWWWRLLSHLIDQRKLFFWHPMHDSDNSLMRALRYLNSNQFVALASKYWDNSYKVRKCVMLFGKRRARQFFLIFVICSNFGTVYFVRLVIWFAYVSTLWGKKLYHFIFAITLSELSILEQNYIRIISRLWSVSLCCLVTSSIHNRVYDQPRFCHVSVKVNIIVLNI